LAILCALVRLNNPQFTDRDSNCRRFNRSLTLSAIDQTWYARNPAAFPCAFPCASISVKATADDNFLNILPPKKCTARPTSPLGRTADVDIRNALAATLERRHPENPQLFPSGFDTVNPRLPVSIVSISVWRRLETWHPKAFGA
jgi:hypothetical protein